jgi:hypothetical protein
MTSGRRWAKNISMGEKKEDEVGRGGQLVGVFISSIKHECFLLVIGAYKCARQSWSCSLFEAEERNVCYHL